MELLNSNGRRVRQLRIARDMMAELFRQDVDKQIIFRGMPADAKVVGISEHVYFDRDEIALKVQSESFPEIGGGSIPELYVTASIWTPSSEGRALSLAADARAIMQVSKDTSSPPSFAEAMRLAIAARATEKTP